MSDPPPRATGSATFSGNEIKKLSKRTRLAAWLVCVCLLGWGGWKIAHNVLPFFDGGTKLRVIHIFLADLNADGHQDAYLVTNQVHRIVFNDGAGNFTSSQGIMMRNYALALEDLDGDGEPEAILLDTEIGEAKIECADLPAEYVIPAYPETLPHQVFAIRDANRDGLPENYIAGCCGGGTSMWNYADLFLNHHSCLESENPNAIALGDLNGDGTLDVFLVKGWTPQASTSPNEVWFNDGQGNFTDSGQRLGNSESDTVALGDLNGDSFLDAVVGKRNGGDIWFNDGNGNFTDSRQRLGSGMTRTTYVTDLDNDGDLDIFRGSTTSGRVWLNGGDGYFKAGQRITYDYYDSVVVGDVTGDSVADIFIAGPASWLVRSGDGNGLFEVGFRSAYR